MQNKKLLILIILCVNIAIYFLVYIYIASANNKRVDVLLNQEVKNLKTNYKITTNYFQVTSESVVEVIKNDDSILKILKNYLISFPKERELLRKELYDLVEPQYKRLKEYGVLQFHFVMPNNVTLLRMHKINEHSDDLTSIKYSFNYVNSKKESIRGLEEGKTSPGFRDVNPLFSKDGIYLGCVDVSFSPETLQKNLLESSNIESSFIFKKDVVELLRWKRDDSNKLYKQSIENQNYYEYKNKFKNENFSAEILKGFKDEISLKMKSKKEFAIYNQVGDDMYIVAFLPVKNIKKEVIAYLVSYSKSPALKALYKDFYILNFLIIIVIMVISYFVYKNIVSNRQLKKEKDKFHHLSLYDTLTKLPNRLLFQERIEQSILKAQRNKSKFSLLFIDIDNFKNINDTYGHDVGDKVLSFVAEIISNIIRKDDTLARLGGDEFVIIAEYLINPEDSSVTAKKIVESLKKPLNIDGMRHYVGASVGISIYPDDSHSSVDLLKYADVAMYKAKELGKGNFQFYSHYMMQSVINKVKLERELREAIRNEEFIVYYQPQIDGFNKKLVGMEALVRWKHPVRGLITPFEFIPFAEEMGLAIEIDEIVMKAAMKQFHQWYKMGLNPGVLSLNLSVDMLQQKDYISKMNKIMKENGFNSQWLCLEITESQIMSDPNKAIYIFNQLSYLGIELAIDDFGTGYSSLSYLKRLPIDKLKIDQSFIRDLPDNEGDIVIAVTIIALAKSLNLTVIAEGVETIAQRDFLVENGCFDIQGFFYSRPLPKEGIEKKFLCR